MSSKLYKLALWYIGKWNVKWDKPKKEVKSLDRLTYRNCDKAYLSYGADAEWQKVGRYDVLDNAIQRLAEYEDLQDMIGIPFEEFAELCKEHQPEDCKNPNKTIILTDESVDEWEQYKKDKEQGLLHKAKIADGTPIFVWQKDDNNEWFVHTEPYIYGVTEYHYGEIGKDVFLSEADAMEKNMEENKYTCEAYDSGYCYSLGRPLTNEEDNICEYVCCCINQEEAEQALAEMKGE